MCSILGQKGAGHVICPQGAESNGKDVYENRGGSVLYYKHAIGRTEAGRKDEMVKGIKGIGTGLKSYESCSCK